MQLLDTHSVGMKTPNKMQQKRPSKLPSICNISHRIKISSNKQLVITKENDAQFGRMAHMNESALAHEKADFAAADINLICII